MLISFSFFFFLVVPYSMWGFIHEQGSNLCSVYWKHSHNHWTTKEVPVTDIFKQEHECLESGKKIDLDLDNESCSSITDPIKCV